MERALLKELSGLIRHVLCITAIAIFKRTLNQAPKPYLEIAVDYDCDADLQELRIKFLFTVVS